MTLKELTEEIVMGICVDLGNGEQVVFETKEYIREYFVEHGYAPSYRDIGLGIKRSTSSVFWAMKILMDRGEIESDLEEPWHYPRAFRLKRREASDLADVMTTEMRCVERQTLPFGCDRKCEECDLCLPTERVLDAYAGVLEILRRKS